MEYTRYEKARIIGARALQITMGAPALFEVPEPAASADASGLARE